jgi:hypothetical protein
VFEGFGVYARNGYPSIFVNGFSILVHVFVWERENGKKPKGHDIHHIDFDKSNYSLDNLSCETKSDHFRIHAGWLRDSSGKWIKKPCKDCKQLLDLDLFYQRKGLTPSNRCKKCSGIYFKSLRTEEFKLKNKKYLKEYYQKNKHKYRKK